MQYGGDADPGKRNGWGSVTGDGGSLDVSDVGEYMPLLVMAKLKYGS